MRQVSGSCAPGTGLRERDTNPLGLGIQLGRERACRHEIAATSGHFDLAAQGRQPLGSQVGRAAAETVRPAGAEAIPDPLLRADALASHRDKGSNSEGLAALAVLAPARPAAPSSPAASSPTS